MNWELDIRNVGGIRDGRATLQPGVNAVRGTNSRGKSSFLAAIETAMGTNAPLTDGQDEGRVELATDDETIVVELVREDGMVRTRGTPYLDDDAARTRADLYAFLDEGNELRRAVRNGENLEDALTRPLDFENIDERIASLKRERSQIDSELERVTEAAERLPAVEERIRKLETELSELTDRRDALAGDDVDRLTDRRDELGDLRAERDHVADRIDRLERSVERTAETLTDRREELDALDPLEETDLDDRIEERRDRMGAVERDLELLRSVYAANRRVLDEDRLDLLGDVERTVLDDEVDCWLCGNAADREQFEAQLDALADRIADCQADVDERREELDRIEERRDRVRQHRRRRAELAETVADLEETLSERKDSLESARARYESLDERIADLADVLDEESDRLTEIESEIKYTRSELDDERGRRESLSERADRRSQLEDERASLTDEIERLRERRDRIRRQTREAFQDAAASITSLFDTGFETARLTPDFDLVVARDGRETSLDAVSESELELLSIIAALAGHEAYDVAEDVPLLLVDRIGGIADDNVRTLVEYLRDRVEILVFTTFPENATGADHEITPDGWTVVTDSA